MDTLEYKKKNLELQRVTTGLLDLEVKVWELRAEADRLEQHMLISLDKQSELKAELEQLKGAK